MMVGCDWCISILTVLVRSCYLSGLLLYHSPVVFLNRGHPHFGNFNSTIPTGVQVRVSINKLYLVPNWMMASLVGVFRNGRGLGMGSLILSCIDLPVSSMQTLPGTPSRIVKEVIHTQVFTLITSISRNSGIEIPKAWMPTIKKHNKRMVQQRTTDGATYTNHN